MNDAKRLAEEVMAILAAGRPIDDEVIPSIPEMLAEHRKVMDRYWGLRPGIGAGGGV